MIKGVKQLSEKSQILEKPKDAVKDSYVLEFLDLPKANNYSESDRYKKVDCQTLISFRHQPVMKSNISLSKSSTSSPPSII